MLRDEDKPLAATVGRNAREYRLRKGVTQEEVAEAVGLSAQVYSRLERGLVLPSLSSFVALCTALEARPDQLLLLRGALPDGDAEPMKTRDSRLAHHLHALSPKDVALLLALARRLRGAARRSGKA